MKIALAIVSFFLLISCQDTYDIPHGVPSNVLIYGDYAYTTNGEDGIDVIDLVSLQTVNKIYPYKGMGSFDDIHITDNLLFVIDSRGKDYLAVYSLSNPTDPELKSGPVRVEGGPFNGIAASNGNVIVSGGTSFLNFRKYKSDGELSTAERTFGRDRGHPDVTICDDGSVAYLSTDFNGEVDDAAFGIITLQLGGLSELPHIISEKGIPGSGFTDGTTKPTGFPIKTALYQDYLLVAHGRGLSIIELVNKSGLSTVTTIDLDLASTAITIHNDIAYVVGLANVPMLYKIDLSNAPNLQIIESMVLDTGTSIPTSIAANDSRLLIAANEKGLLVMAP